MDKKERKRRLQLRRRRIAKQLNRFAWVRDERIDCMGTSRGYSDDGDNTDDDGTENDTKNDIENDELMNYDDEESETINVEDLDIEVSMDEEANNKTLKAKLKQWALKLRVNHAQLNSLLHILQPYHSELPNDSRTLLGTPREVHKRELENGLYTHFKVEEGIIKRLAECKSLKNEAKTINLDINIDGLPLFKNSNLQTWPILVRSYDFQNSSPIPVGLFTGTGKPNPLREFMHDFVSEMSTLLKYGIVYKGISYSIKIRSIICDAPARAYIKSIAGHNSAHGCEKCEVEGYSFERRTIFDSFDAPLRTKESFNNQIDSDHHHGQSPLLLLDIDCINDIPLDPMHLVYLGITKKLLGLWVQNGKPPYKFSSTVTSLVSDRLLSLHGHIPGEFVRKTRCLKMLSYWKATEFRIFLLYVGPVALWGLVEKPVYDNFLLLHVAIRILTCPKYVSSHLQLANKLIKTFVQHASQVYGKTFLIYNAHSITHLCNDVERFGCLENFSTFPFENYLGILKSYVRVGPSPHQQLVKRLMELNSLEKNDEDKKLGASMKHNDKILPGINEEDLRAEYRRFSFPNFEITVAAPNNCVYIKENIVKVENIVQFKSGSYKIIGRSFEKEDFYTYPVPSSLLGVYKLLKLTNKMELFDINAITYKCVLLPLNSNHSVSMPLLHLEGNDEVGGAVNK